MESAVILADNGTDELEAIANKTQPSDKPVQLPIENRPSELLTEPSTSSDAQEPSEKPEENQKKEFNCLVDDAIASTGSKYDSVTHETNERDSKRILNFNSLLSDLILPHDLPAHILPVALPRYLSATLPRTAKRRRPPLTRLWAIAEEDETGVRATRQKKKKHRRTRNAIQRTLSAGDLGFTRDHARSVPGNPDEDCTSFTECSTHEKIQHEKEEALGVKADNGDVSCSEVLPDVFDASNYSPINAVGLPDSDNDGSSGRLVDGEECTILCEQKALVEHESVNFVTESLKKETQDSSLASVRSAGKALTDLSQLESGPDCSSDSYEHRNKQNSTDERIEQCNVSNEFDQFPEAALEPAEGISYTSNISNVLFRSVVCDSESENVEANLPSFPSASIAECLPQSQSVTDEDVIEHPDERSALMNIPEKLVIVGAEIRVDSLDRPDALFGSNKQCSEDKIPNNYDGANIMDTTENCIVNEDESSLIFFYENNLERMSRDSRACETKKIFPAHELSINLGETKTENSEASVPTAISELVCNDLNQVNLAENEHNVSSEPASIEEIFEGEVGCPLQENDLNLKSVEDICDLSHLDTIPCLISEFSNSSDTCETHFIANEKEVYKSLHSDALPDGNVDSVEEESTNAKLLFFNIIDGGINSRCEEEAAFQGTYADSPSQPKARNTGENPSIYKTTQSADEDFEAMPQLSNESGGLEVCVSNGTSTSSQESGIVQGAVADKSIPSRECNDQDTTQESGNALTENCIRSNVSLNPPVGKQSQNCIGIEGKVESCPLVVIRMKEVGNDENVSNEEDTSSCAFSTGFELEDADDTVMYAPEVNESCESYLASENVEGQPDDSSTHKDLLSFQSAFVPANPSFENKSDNIENSDGISPVSEESVHSATETADNCFQLSSHTDVKNCELLPLCEPHHSNLVDSTDDICEAASRVGYSTDIDIFSNGSERNSLVNNVPKAVEADVKIHLAKISGLLNPLKTVRGHTLMEETVHGDVLMKESVCGDVLEHETVHGEILMKELVNDDISVQETDILIEETEHNDALLKADNAECHPRSSACSETVAVSESSSAEQKVLQAPLTEAEINEAITPDLAETTCLGSSNDRLSSSKTFLNISSHEKKERRSTLLSFEEEHVSEQDSSNSMSISQFTTPNESLVLNHEENFHQDMLSMNSSDVAELSECEDLNGDLSWSDNGHSWSLDGSQDTQNSLLLLLNNPPVAEAVRLTKYVQNYDVDDFTIDPVEVNKDEHFWKKNKLNKVPLVNSQSSLLEENCRQKTAQPSTDEYCLNLDGVDPPALLKPDDFTSTASDRIVLQNEQLTSQTPESALRFVASKFCKGIDQNHKSKLDIVELEQANDFTIFSDDNNRCEVPQIDEFKSVRVTVQNSSASDSAKEDNRCNNTTKNEELNPSHDHLPPTADDCLQDTKKNYTIVLPPAQDLNTCKENSVCKDAFLTKSCSASSNGKGRAIKWFEKGFYRYATVSHPSKLRITKMTPSKISKKNKDPVSILSMNPLIEQNSTFEKESDHSSCDTIRSSVSADSKLSSDSSTIDDKWSGHSSDGSACLGKSSDADALTPPLTTKCSESYLLDYKVINKHRSDRNSSESMTGCDVASCTDTTSLSLQRKSFQRNLQCIACDVREQDYHLSELKKQQIYESTDPCELCDTCQDDKLVLERCFVCARCSECIQKPRRGSKESGSLQFVNNLSLHSSLPNFVSGDNAGFIPDLDPVKFWVDPSGNFICYHSNLFNSQSSEVEDWKELESKSVDSQPACFPISWDDIIPEHMHSCTDFETASCVTDSMDLDKDFESKSNFTPGTSIRAKSEKSATAVRRRSRINLGMVSPSKFRSSNYCSETVKRNSNCEQLTLNRDSESSKPGGRYSKSLLLDLTESHTKSSNKGSLPDLSICSSSKPCTTPIAQINDAQKSFSNVRRRLAKTRRRHRSVVEHEVEETLADLPSREEGNELRKMALSENNSEERVSNIDSRVHSVEEAKQEESGKNKQIQKLQNRQRRRSSFANLAAIGLAKWQGYLHGHHSTHNVSVKDPSKKVSKARCVPTDVFEDISPQVDVSTIEKLTSGSNSEAKSSDGSTALRNNNEISDCKTVSMDEDASLQKYTCTQSSFGKPSGGGRRRTNECLILESSSVIAIDYPDVQIMRPGIGGQQQLQQQQSRSGPNPLNVDRLLALDPDNTSQHRQPSHHVNNQHNINMHGQPQHHHHQQQQQQQQHVTSRHHQHYQQPHHRHTSNGAVVRSSSNPPPLPHGPDAIATAALQHHIPSQPQHRLQHHSNHHHDHHPHSQSVSINNHHAFQQQQQQHHHMAHQQIVVTGGAGMGGMGSPTTASSTEAYLPDLVRGVRSRGSLASGGREGSDTSSAYSGSDTMCHSVHSLDHDDVDLSGLMESVVDSDEEDLAESMETMAVRDAVRDCLEKDPSERTEDDIKVLLEFTQRLKAFADKTLAVRRAMCQAMVFAVVEDAGTVLMNDGEELDSWSVIINGHVQVMSSTGSYELHLGDSFGIPPTMEKLHHSGVMRSMVDDCQFVCIRQSDYYRILHQGEENTQKVEEDGKLVLVMEQRHIEAMNRKGNIVIKGTPERLMSQLVEVENCIDPTYVEDFLLTHRTFLKSPLDVAQRLLQWFENCTLRNLVTRVVLLWVNNHFTDFEMDPVMMNFLEQFEERLEREKMDGQLRLLDFACAAKARSRTVTLTRPSRDEILHFSILGGYKKKYGIFISKVEKNSKAEEVGLKRGDQILEVNGQSFEHIEHTRALEILRSTCHLAITVKSNLLAFKEMLQTPENSPRPHNRKASDVSSGSGHSTGSSKNVSAASDFASTLNLVNTLASPRSKKDQNNHKAAFMTLKAHWLKDAIKNLLPKNSQIESGAHSDDSVSSQSSSVGGPAFHSHSNPDLTAIPYEETRQEFPEHVLKVWRASDQSAKFLPVHQETTAREVVMLALQIFNINDQAGSSNYALYEVTVTEEGIRKQKRLPDRLQNLAERIGLSSRYYLKNIASSQNLVPDEIVNELIKESQVTFLQLNSVELAIQLTLEDFAIFRQIEPTEYIDHLFELKSKYGTPALSLFAELVNKEMFWVVTEVCSEPNIVKRSKIIKQFIKVARQCKECKNFNSMFAILSGLGHRSVSRLRATWERLPAKYHKLFQDLQDLMDPSRNMSKYRNLIHDDATQPPCIPFYPVVAKDLRFAHDGNEESSQGLINFETLRMISRYIRDLQNMCSTPYDLVSMVESGGQPVSTAMFSMNQMSAGQQHNTVKRRNKSATTHDKKKMFEEAQMVRRVKAYLAKLSVITDEDELEKKSHQCEPGVSHGAAAAAAAASASAPGSGSASSTSSGHGSGVSSTTSSSSAPSSSNPPRRRPHSPTPSTTSSTSSTSHTSDGRKPAKFGAGSPQSMRKMMALAEAKTKPYHGPRPSSTPSSGATGALHSPGPSPRIARRGPTGALAGGLATITTSHLNSATNLANSSRPNHERSHSDTPALPVDLSAESSSVTTLSNIRKSHTQGNAKPSLRCTPNPVSMHSSSHFSRNDITRQRPVAHFKPQPILSSSKIQASFTTGLAHNTNSEFTQSKLVSSNNSDLTDEQLNEFVPYITLATSLIPTISTISPCTSTSSWTSPVYAVSNSISCSNHIACRLDLMHVSSGSLHSCSIENFRCGQTLVSSCNNDLTLSDVNEAALHCQSYVIPPSERFNDNDRTYFLPDYKGSAFSLPGTLNGDTPESRCPHVRRFSGSDIASELVQCKSNGTNLTEEKLPDIKNCNFNYLIEMEVSKAREYSCSRRFKSLSKDGRLKRFRKQIKSLLKFRLVHDSPATMARVDLDSVADNDGNFYVNNNDEALERSFHVLESSSNSINISNIRGTPELYPFNTSSSETSLLRNEFSESKDCLADEGEFGWPKTLGPNLSCGSMYQNTFESTDPSRNLTLNSSTKFDDKNCTRIASEPCSKREVNLSHEELRCNSYEESKLSFLPNESANYCFSFPSNASVDCVFSTTDHAISSLLPVTELSESLDSIQELRCCGSVPCNDLCSYVGLISNSNFCSFSSLTSSPHHRQLSSDMSPRNELCKKSFLSSNEAPCYFKRDAVVCGEYLDGFPYRPITIVGIDDDRNETLGLNQLFISEIHTGAEKYSTHFDDSSSKPAPEIETIIKSKNKSRNNVDYDKKRDRSTSVTQISTVNKKLSKPKRHLSAHLSSMTNRVRMKYRSRPSRGTESDGEDLPCSDGSNTPRVSTSLVRCPRKGHSKKSEVSFSSERLDSVEECGISNRSPLPENVFIAEESEDDLDNVELGCKLPDVTHFSQSLDLRSMISNESVAVSQCETDSGISTHYDGHSSHSLDTNEPHSGGKFLPPSPPPHHRRYSQQPDARRHRPPFLNAVAVLPPLPLATSPPGCPPRRRGGSTAVPPDYPCTQMRLMQQMGRAMSHDAAVQYYHNPVPVGADSHHMAVPAATHREDEEEAQVSAV